MKLGGVNRPGNSSFYRWPVALLVFLGNILLGKTSNLPETAMKGILIGVGFVGAYIALQVWILPAMGIQT